MKLEPALEKSAVGSWGEIRKQPTLCTHKPPQQMRSGPGGANALGWPRSCLQGRGCLRMCLLLDVDTRVTASHPQLCSRSLPYAWAGVPCNDSGHRELCSTWVTKNSLAIEAVVGMPLEVLWGKTSEYVSLTE